MKDYKINRYVDERNNFEIVVMTIIFGALVSFLAWKEVCNYFGF